MVKSPLTLEISVALNFSFHRTMATPSNSGRMTKVGSNAIASSRNRTEWPWNTRLEIRLDIPQRTFAIDGFPRDAKPAGGFVLVAAGLLQHRQDMTTLHFGEIVCRARCRL